MTHKKFMVLIATLTVLIILSVQSVPVSALTWHSSINEGDSFYWELSTFLGSAPTISIPSPSGLFPGIGNPIVAGSEIRVNVTAAPPTSGDWQVMVTSGATFLDVIVDDVSCSSCNMLAFFFIAPLDDGYGDPGWDHWLKRIKQSIIDEAGSFLADSYIDGSFTTYKYNGTYTAGNSQFFLEHVIVYQQGTGILRNYTYTKNEVGQPISDSIFISRTHLSTPGFEVIPIAIALVFLALIPLLWRRRK
ncbi:MAG: hypothetical protein ACFFCZ_16625 [Promethearchaeota archaeon]